MERTESSSMIIQDTILQMIEKALMEGNKNILSFVYNFQEELLKKYSLAIIEDTMKRLSLKKTISFIRHAEAEHNSSAHPSYETKRSINDSQITLKGLDQASKIGKILIKEMPNCSLICISPLKRALQTFTCFSKLYESKSYMKYIVTDLIRESLTPFPKNIGMALPELKTYIINDIKQNQIDTSYMTKTYWWTDDDKEVYVKKHEPELLISFQWRLRLFLFWMLFRKENDICMISHSKVCQQLINQGIHNGKMKYITQDMLFKHCLLFMTKKIDPFALK